MINGADIVRDRALFAALYFGGLRNSEVRNLYVDDCDRERRRFTIRAHDGFHPKNYEVRKVKIPEVGARIVEKWLAQRATIPSKSPYLFIMTHDDKFSIFWLRNLVYEWGEKAEVGHVFPHMLRHSRISFLVNEARPVVPVPKVQLWAGDAHIETTMRYVHHDPDSLDADIDRVSEIDL